MSDRDFVALSDFVRAPAHELSAHSADIRPVHAGLFTAHGNPLLVSSVGVLPSMLGALAAIRGFFGDKWFPGDVALTNDMDAGAVNACEIITVAPIHSGSALTGWSVVRGRVPDFGGWEPGGYSPQAVDRWAEGARLEPVKVMIRGAYRREVTDLLRLNSRTPTSTLSNVRRLADTAAKFGQAYSHHAGTTREKISVLQRAELEQVKAAFEKLPMRFRPHQGEIAAPWLNKQFGSIDVGVAKSGDRLRITLSGPPIAASPINLGLFAAQDIITAAVAATCELDDLVTDALSTRLDVSLQTPGLVSAPLPATVGLGRQISGHVLFRALVTSLGLSSAQAEPRWQHYRETVCGTDFDPQTGMLAVPSAVRIRERQSEEVAA